MKRPASPNAGGGNHSGAAVENSISESGPCPHAAECHRHSNYLTGTETAECASCYQILSRENMARIFAGC